MDLVERSLDEIKIKCLPKLSDMYILYNTEVPRGSDTPLYLRKEQKINDRLQDKINVLKNQTNSNEGSRPPLQSNISKDQLNKSK